MIRGRAFARTVMLRRRRSVLAGPPDRPRPRRPKRESSCSPRDAIIARRGVRRRRAGGEDQCVAARRSYAAVILRLAHERPTFIRPRRSTWLLNAVERRAPYGQGSVATPISASASAALSSPDRLCPGEGRKSNVTAGAKKGTQLAGSVRLTRCSSGLW